MTDSAVFPVKFPWPPLVYLIALAGGVSADIAYPLPWIGEPLSDILFAAGCVMVAGVIAIYVSALRALARAKTTVSPIKPAAHLVTDGAYAFSRNPLYLANTMFVIGIGLVAGSLWFPLFAVLAAFATSRLQIEPEERYLKTHFGKRYHDYARRVRRWV